MQRRSLPSITVIITVIGFEGRGVRVLLTLRWVIDEATFE